MQRRQFLGSLGALAILPFAGTRDLTPCRKSVLVQQSALAGFQYHDGGQVWSALRVGDPLKLIREHNNTYDVRAVRVDWQGRKLGYVPRLENAAVAQMLDGGHVLQARITQLRHDPNPWKRINFEVRLLDH